MTATGRVSLPVPAGSGNVDAMDDDELLEVLRATAAAVTAALADLSDWGLAGTRAGQYRSDLAADAAALAVLDGAGLGVMSEESGPHRLDRPVIGGDRSRWTAPPTPPGASPGTPPACARSTARARGWRWWSTRRPGSGSRPSAAKDARRDGRPIHASTVPRSWARPSSGSPATPRLPRLEPVPQPRRRRPRPVRGGRRRAGRLRRRRRFAPRELGLPGRHADLHRGRRRRVGESEGRDLVTLDHGDRRTPVAAATPDLLDQLAEAVSRS